VREQDVSNKYQLQRPQIKTASAFLPILDGDRNFGLNNYQYHTGMSGERSGKHNDKFLGNKFEQLQLASKK